jgi:hypothetical protein
MVAAGAIRNGACPITSSRRATERFPRRGTGEHAPGEQCRTFAHGAQPSRDEVDGRWGAYSFLGDGVIDRQPATAFEEDREAEQVQQQLELEAAFEGEETDGKLDGEHDNGELDDQHYRGEPGQQTDRQQNPAEELDERGFPC